MANGDQPHFLTRREQQQRPQVVAAYTLNFSFLGNVLSAVTWSPNESQFPRKVERKKEKKKTLINSSELYSVREKNEIGSVTTTCWYKFIPTK